MFRGKDLREQFGANLGFVGTYVGHQQQSFKEAWDARGGLLQGHQEVRRVRKRCTTRIDRKASETPTEAGYLVPVMQVTVGLQPVRGIIRQSQRSVYTRVDRDGPRHHPRPGDVGYGRLFR